MNELFRFVAVRPPVKASQTKVIDAGADAASSSFVKALSRAKGPDERRQLATQFMRTPEFIRPPDNLTSPLLRLFDALKTLSPERDIELPGLIESATRTKPEDIVASIAFRTDRTRLLDSYLARHMADPRPSSAKAGLHSLLATAKLVEDVRSLSGLKNGRDVLSYLSHVVITLPPTPAHTAADSQKSAEGARQGRGDRPTADGRQDLIKTRDALIRVSRTYLGTLKGTENDDTDSAIEAGRVTATPPAFADLLNAEGLRAGTSFLAKRGLVPDEDTTHEIINALDDEIARLGDTVGARRGRVRYAFYQGNVIGGVGTAATVDVPPDLLSGLPGTKGIPTLTPPDLEVASPVPEGKGYARILGVGDLMVVREATKKYVLGEIAHIESVLKGESKERTHRRTQKIEETIATITEREQETERDLQSTERFELSKETSEVVKFDSKLEAGFNLSASYGAVSVSANSSLSVGLSAESIKKSASDYSRDVTERAKNRVIEKTREERTRKLVQEIEEINKHAVDNASGTGHVVGVYRWVDKISHARLLNYGKRLMLEFVVPEPAALLVRALIGAPPKGITVSPPDPELLGYDARLITEENYRSLARLYGVTDIDPPPVRYIRQAETFDFPQQESDVSQAVSKKIPIKDGYHSTKVTFNRSMSRHNSETRIKVIGGRSVATMVGPNVNQYKREFSQSYVGELPVAVVVVNQRALSVTVTVDCERLDETFAAWQIKTFKALLEGYQKVQSQYDEQLALASIQRGANGDEFSPDRNRATERNELKRSAISILTNQHFDLFGAIVDNADGLPNIDFSQAIPEGRYVQFFENAFEWANVSYVFYPYFWGRRTTWVEKIAAESSDPTHLAFLQAGAARMVVPVRPGYETVVIYYLDQGEIWGGDDIPTLESVSTPYVDVTTEIREQQGNPAVEPIIVDEWDVTLPTSLVMLQADATLPEFSV